MVRRVLRLDYGAGRDADGIIHLADKPGLWMKAACSGARIGTNPVGLRGYCQACYPEYTKKVKTSGGEIEINHDMRVEEIEVNSWDLPKIPKVKPKPELTKTLEEIMRKDKVTFKRRPIVTYNDYGRFLKKS